MSEHVSDLALLISEEQAIDYCRYYDNHHLEVVKGFFLNSIYKHAVGSLLSVYTSIVVQCGRRSAVINAPVFPWLVMSCLIFLVTVHGLVVLDGREGKWKG